MINLGLFLYLTEDGGARVGSADVPRCAQQKQVPKEWHHRGVLPGGHPPHTPEGQSRQGPGAAAPLLGCDTKQSPALALAMGQALLLPQDPVFKDH